MLTVIDKKGRAVGPLEPGACEDLLAAFTRPGASARERERGAAIVRGYQQRQCWLRCSCLGARELAPVLVPVAERHLRREPSYPDHADACPFETDTTDRERMARSMRLRAPGDGFRLARPITEPGDEDTPRTVRTGPSKAYRRDRLSQLLFKAIADTGLHRVGCGPRGWADQVQALHIASRGISLGEELRLSGVLEIDPARIDGLVGRIEARSGWPRGRRPHGVLTFIAERIEGGDLVDAAGVRVVVDGPISVFGPGRGGNRQGPFVVAALIASPDGIAPFAVLQAYAHPCWSATDMLPVDSTHERRCLDILVRFQGWMAARDHIVEITKPLYDRSAYYLGRADADQVIKPDFEGTIHTAAGAWVRSFVVECKGFDHDEYRAAKVRLKAVLTAKGAYYLDHLAFDPQRAEEHDRRFIHDLARLGEWAINKGATVAGRTLTTWTPPPRARAQHRS